MICILFLTGFLAIAAQSVEETGKITGNLPSIHSLNSCQYLQNISDVETLDRHQYNILEQCLYYYLAGEAQRKAGRFGGIRAIVTLSPNSESKSIPVTINFHQITLQHFELNEFTKDITIQGYMAVSWIDKRLSWNENDWNLKKLSINSIAHVWVPLITAQTYETALRNGDLLEMRKIEANSNGTVNAIINFSLRTFCDDADFQNFPDDVYRCCFQLEPHINQNVEFTTNGRPIFTDPRYFRDYGWLLSGTVPVIQNYATSITQLVFCMNLQRSTNSVRIELTLPTTITSLLFLITPLFGKIQLQIFTKLFVLFLQFLALQLFSNRIAPHLGSAAATPKLLKFHEYAMMINTMSILISVILWMLARIRRRLPPWAWLIQLSQIVNGLLCAFNSSELAITELPLEKVETTSSYQSDWANAFNAIHSVAVGTISIVFILGYIIIL
ncbi:unnamed protein product [Dracunculus medinensis]|uniref:Neur_chan_LBD domain-containing protein n=1 Tax=Dracunculus medinensis TaxID=318479 RepID=A0A0N4UBF7_DRAME|nr:unnamed protein product [Dracunculus medinensis]